MTTTITPDATLAALRARIEPLATWLLKAQVDGLDLRIARDRTDAQAAHADGQPFDYTDLQASVQVRYVILDVLEGRDPAWVNHYFDTKYPDF